MLDGAGDRLGREVVAQLAQQGPQLVGGQQEEQHEHVGLLGHLVVVDGTALRLQDPVQALEIAMAVSVVRPVQIGEFAVTRELADHSVLGDRNRHPPADVLPPQLLDRVEVERLDQLGAADGRQRREHVAGPCRSHTVMTLV